MGLLLTDAPGLLVPRLFVSGSSPRGGLVTGCPKCCGRSSQRYLEDISVSASEVSGRFQRQQSREQFGGDEEVGRV